MNIPAELKYSTDHEWVRMDGDVAVIGVSDFAQDALGDLVFINLPEVGDAVTAGDAFGDVESVKAVSDLLSPVTGTVCEINEELLDAPEKINEDPYGAWMIKVENIEATEEEIDLITRYAFRVNEVLKDYFLKLNITLVDFKLEFGRLPDGTIVLADEISPDTCRFWDVNTGEKLDKDRFRRDLGGVEDAYNEVMRRLTGK